MDPSPWPLVASIGGLGMTFGGVMYMHNYSGGGTLFLTGFTTTIFVMYTWWKDIVREGTYEGQHTKQVQQGLRWGMILFIVSEVMFFFAFFCVLFVYNLDKIYNFGQDLFVLGSSRRPRRWFSSSLTTSASGIH